MNRAEAMLIAKYEALLSAEGVGMPTTPEENALTQEAITRSWTSLGAQDQRHLARYWKTPEATS